MVKIELTESGARLGVRVRPTNRERLSEEDHSPGAFALGHLVIED
jgi:hypothetical protein